MFLDAKRRWLKALESGNYKKGRYGLRTRDTYCATGVLCDIYRAYIGGEWVESKKNSGMFRLNVKGQYYISYIPEEILELTGLSKEDVDMIQKINDSSEDEDFSQAIRYIKSML